MRLPNRTFTLYDKDRNPWTVNQIWARTAGDVGLESELWTTTLAGVPSQVTNNGDGVYRAIEDGTILTKPLP
jgi:hypothetical protein